MPNIRDIKLKARRVIHERMSVPALYIEYPGAAPRLISVRVHTSFDALGDQKGTNFNSAEREDILPRLIFMRNEVANPRRNAVVSVEPGEAYFVDAVEPPDNITVSAHAVRLNASQAANLPVPGEAS